jgi:phosphoribosylformylglycinamidine cyclo-ligase
VSGVAEGCRQAGCALVGGETAEMPGFYAGGEYDLAGFCVGIADKSKIINGHTIQAGDALIGLGSSGVHSNGFSLVRKLFSEDKAGLERFEPALGKTYFEEVLTPTRIYVKTILALIEKFTLKGIAHITGGGFIENIPRILPEGVGASVDTNAYELPAVFKLLGEKSGLGKQQLYNTFNMGVGMVLCVDKGDAAAVMTAAKDLGEKAFLIGETVKGSGVTLL